MKQYKTYLEEESKTIHWLDEKFKELISEYTIQEWEIPTMIDEDVLVKCGYFKTMPNHLTPVGYINLNDIETVLSSGKISKDNILFKKIYLAPAACLHIYPMLEQNPVMNQIITIKGHAYRYEENGFVEGERQWDFFVREFVAIGEPEYVKGFLNIFQKRILERTQVCGLSCRIRAASDPFFPTKENNLMKMKQKANGLKYELVFDNRLAIGSFNYHGFHFSKPFHFDQERKVVSGCVGFGFDRWVKALKDIKSEYNGDMSSMKV